MYSYVALFRGINVGGHNLLPMAALTAILEEVGCLDIQTYIQSGNVTFRIPRKPGKKKVSEITNLIETRHGFTPVILLLEKSELDAAIGANPYPTTEGKSLHFYFLASTPEHPDLDSLQNIKMESENFKLKDAVLYLHAPDGIGRSKLAARIEKCVGVNATARNWNTVKKLHAMIGA